MIVMYALSDHNKFWLKRCFRVKKVATTYCSMSFLIPPGSVEPECKIYFPLVENPLISNRKYIVALPNFKKLVRKKDIVKGNENVLIVWYSQTTNILCNLILYIIYKFRRCYISAGRFHSFFSWYS
jgi:hypothetical protein